MKDREPSMGRVASFVGVITVTGLLAACGGDESQP
jgi:hypothetical protein